MAVVLPGLVALLGKPALANRFSMNCRKVLIAEKNEITLKLSHCLSW